MMNRKKMGIALITLIAISAGIMLSLNQPIDSITTGTEDYTQLPDALSFTWERVNLTRHKIYRPQSSNETYVIITVPIGVENITADVYLPIPSNATHSGFKEYIGTYEVTDDMSNSDGLQWNVTRWVTILTYDVRVYGGTSIKVPQTMEGPILFVYGWVKVIS